MSAEFAKVPTNAIIHYDTLPAYCISKAIVMKSGEIIYEKVYVSPRPPPTIFCKDTWTCNLDSDVARSSEDIQRIEQKPNTQLSSTGRLLNGVKKPWNVPSLIATLLIERNMIMSQIQRVRGDPYVDRKQNISEFKSLYRGSKIILIEQHFKPICSRITSTIHSAKIRGR